MKKILLYLLLSACSQTMFSQTYKNDGKPYYFYCELTAEYNLAGKLRLTLAWPGKREQEQLRDENGQKIEFANLPEIINYMSKRNWDLNKTYENGSIVTFLFRKEVTSDAEAKDGLIFKSDKN